MKNIARFLVVSSFAFAAAVAQAQDARPAAVATPAVNAAEANADVVAEVKASDLLDTAFDEYARKRKFVYGTRAANGSTYYRGSAVVDRHVEDAMFVKSRAFAYERAYLDAVGRYVMDCYGRETAKTCLEVFNDQSSGNEEPPAMTPADLAKKIELLSEAKLDKALSQAGVDPSKYQGSPIVEKRRLMQDSIVKASVKKALHASSGCLPVKTFEARGTDGRYSIGVVVRVGADCRTLAEAFKAKRRPAMSRDGGISVADALPKTPDEMVQTFGVRIFFDESGTPSLLSFGQFGSSYKGKSARSAERAEEQARRQAQALADSALTTFINSFVDIAEESELAENVSDSRIFRADQSVEPEEVSEIVDRYRKSISQTATDTMKGRTTVYDRVVPHPSGARVAVCVRRWSFDQVDAVNEADSVRPTATAPASPAKTKAYDAGVRSSATYDF